MSNPILHLQQLSRHVMQGEARLDILRHVDLAIQPGEIVALVGPSGSGKTTLLQIAGLLARPDSGRVALNGTDCTHASDAGRTKMRRETLGFVYQFHHLLPEFTAEENAMMPLLIAEASPSEARRQSRALLETLGLGERLHHRPSELSGGEQQRVAIARALIHRPKLVLADEPTGNLDPDTAEQVFRLFAQHARERGASALVATHNLELARRMDRIVRMERGILRE